MWERVCSVAEIAEAKIEGMQIPGAYLVEKEIQEGVAMEEVE